jgi:magnesium chelatase accessory protein
VPLRVAERAARIMPQAKLITLPGIGHLAHEEAPAPVAAKIRRFTAET